LTIYSEIAVSYLQAILGDTVEITTVDGKVNLKIPSGTQPNTTLFLRIKGYLDLVIQLQEEIMKF